MSALQSMYDNAINEAIQKYRDASTNLANKQDDSLLSYQEIIIAQNYLVIAQNELLLLYCHK